jgi:cobalt/nickel transport system ATP-binding protein
MGVAHALSVEGLSYAYPGGVSVLQDVTFHIEAHERVALLGANGAGKSTLLWCLVGILPGEGRVIVGGTELAPGSEAEVRRKLGLSFSEPDDQLFMPTVIRDLAFGPRAAGSSPQAALERARAAAGQVELDDGLLERAPHELSSGERRRAALAAVLTLGPEVLALDEPSNSLDARGRAALARTLARLPCAQLIATHDLDFAARICSRGLVLMEGRLAADENLPALLADGERLIEYGLLAPEEVR